MPLVKARMGDACKFYTIDKGLAGGAPDSPATYVGSCDIYVDSLETFQQEFAKHGQEFMADLVNFTEASPVIQLNELVVGP